MVRERRELGEPRVGQVGLDFGRALGDAPAAVPRRRASGAPAAPGGRRCVASRIRRRARARVPRACRRVAPGRVAQVARTRARLAGQGLADADPMSVRRVPVPTAGVDGGPTAPGASPSRLEQYLQSVLAAGARERARAAKAAPSADPKPADDAPGPADAPKAAEPADVIPSRPTPPVPGGRFFCAEFRVENDPAIRNADTAALALFRAAVTAMRPTPRRRRRRLRA